MNRQVAASNPSISYVFLHFRPENILKCDCFKHQNQLPPMSILSRGGADLRRFRLVCINFAFVLLDYDLNSNVSQL